MASAEDNLSGQVQGPNTSKVIFTAIGHFQLWVSVLYERRLARLKENRSGIEIAPPVAKRFSLGFSGESVLLGAMAEEMSWAGTMPWSHAAIYRGRNTLHIVGSRIPYADGFMCPFSLSFEFNQEKVCQLEQVGRLEIREVLGRNENGSTMLSRKQIQVMPFAVLEHDEDVLGVREKVEQRYMASPGGQR